MISFFISIFFPFVDRFIDKLFNSSKVFTQNNDRNRVKGKSMALNYIIICLCYDEIPEKNNGPSTYSTQLIFNLTHAVTLSTLNKFVVVTNERNFKQSISNQEGQHLR